MSSSASSEEILPPVEIYFDADLFRGYLPDGHEDQPDPKYYFSDQHLGWGEPETTSRHLLRQCQRIDGLLPGVEFCIETNNAPYAWPEDYRRIDLFADRQGLIVTSRVKAFLESLCPNEIQFLPIKIRMVTEGGYLDHSEFWIVNVLTRKLVVDLVKSGYWIKYETAPYHRRNRETDYHRPGDPAQPVGSFQRIRYDPDLLTPHHIVQDSQTKHIVVSSAVQNFINQNGLLGARLRNLYSNHKETEPLRRLVRPGWREFAEAELLRLKQKLAAVGDDEGAKAHLVKLISLWGEWIYLP